MKYIKRKKLGRLPLLLAALVVGAVVVLGLALPKKARADNWWGTYTCTVTVSGKKCSLDQYGDNTCSSEDHTLTCTVSNINCGETKSGLTSTHQTGCSGLPDSCNATYTKSDCTCTAPACPTATPTPGSTPTPAPPPSNHCPGTCEQPGQCPAGTHEDDNAGTCDNGKVCCVNDPGSGCNDKQNIMGVNHIWYHKFDVVYEHFGGAGEYRDTMAYNVDDGDWVGVGCGWTAPGRGYVWHVEGVPEWDDDNNVPTSDKVCFKYAISCCGNENCWWCNHHPSVACWHRAKVSLSANPSSGLAPKTIALIANATPGSDGLSAYEWDWDGDGKWDWTVQTTNTHYVVYKTFDQGGTYHPRVHVYDSKGFASKIATTTVNIQTPIHINVSYFYDYNGDGRKNTNDRDENYAINEISPNQSMDIYIRRSTESSF